MKKNYTLFKEWSVDPQKYGVPEWNKQAYESMFKAEHAFTPLEQYVINAIYQKPLIGFKKSLSRNKCLDERRVRIIGESQDKQIESDELRFYFLGVSQWVIFTILSFKDDFKLNLRLGIQFEPLIHQQFPQTFFYPEDFHSHPPVFLHHSHWRAFEIYRQQIGACAAVTLAFEAFDPERTTVRRQVIYGDLDERDGLRLRWLQGSPESSS